MNILNIQSIVPIKETNDRTDGNCFFSIIIANSDSGVQTLLLIFIELSLNYFTTKL